MSDPQNAPDRQRMSTSFGTEADSYERGRPGYPLEAVAWMLEQVPPGSTVVDIGAGTGKLTRAMVETGYRVVAVDPDPAMLAKLGEGLPFVRRLIGTGEEIPLDAGSAAAVVGGQMWHWVDPAVASREVSRVLRPEGVLGLIWNIRDEREPWVKRMSEIMSNSAAERLIADGGVELGDGFTNLQESRFEWERSISAVDLRAMVRSRSYVITADPDTRRRIDTELEDLFGSLPGLESGGEVSLPYVTHAFRARRA
jgi:SAM-dependent methyltransferase